MEGGCWEAAQGSPLAGRSARPCLRSCPCTGLQLLRQSDGVRDGALGEQMGERLCFLIDASPHILTARPEEKHINLHLLPQVRGKKEEEGEIFLHLCSGTFFTGKVSAVFTRDPELGPSAQALCILLNDTGSLLGTNTTAAPRVYFGPHLSHE